MTPNRAQATQYTGCLVAAVLNIIDGALDSLRTNITLHDSTFNDHMMLQIPKVLRAQPDILRRAPPGVFAGRLTLGAALEMLQFKATLSLKALPWPQPAHSRWTLWMQCRHAA